MTDWHYVRVRPERLGIVRHPQTGEQVTPDPRRPYRSDDPLVTAYPEMFAADTDLAAEHRAAEHRVAADRPVERATRAPGERRPTRR